MRFHLHIQHAEWYYFYQTDKESIIGETTSDNYGFLSSLTSVLATRPGITAT